MEIYLRGAGVEKMERILNSFGSRGQTAVVRALNRALTGIATDAGRETKRAYPGVKVSDVKRGFYTKRATVTSLIATAKSRGHRQPLILFGARPSKPESRRPAIGASVKVTGTRKRVPGAFAARMSSGHVGLFVRTGTMGRNDDPGQERIKELFTFAVPQAIQWIEEHQGAISDGARDRFEKTLDHEMDRIMQKLGAR